ncbi:hypothetical protein H181DRAFT_04687 [Streptomyces sp. WMMB 714]|jgi:hypothetical protein|uniref:hypothetical protein n=1 Tax=Streptomyces sp. WMMB 714 TaxID=1286822 RepID=UPI0008238972|nr:hypothetical protein [Streptomyces sp. WMMB 714]SCK51650.1 hypothetical protein H181DRAFT_04687 [Streptomyces sp. WMMB 714]
MPRTPGPSGPPHTMPRSSKALTVSTVTALVLVTAYTVTLGGSGWLWFAWVVLGLVTVGVVTTQRD